MSAIACRAHLEPGCMPGCSKDDREHFTDGTIADFQLERQEDHSSNREHVDMLMSLVFQQGSESACLVSRPMYTAALPEVQRPGDLCRPSEAGRAEIFHDFQAAEPHSRATSCGSDPAHVPSGSSPAHACGTAACNAAHQRTNDKQSPNRQEAGAESSAAGVHERSAFAPPRCPSSNENDVDLPIKSALKKKRPKDSPDLHRSEPYWPGGTPREDALLYEFEEVQPTPAPVAWAPPPGSFRSAKRGRKKAPASSSQ